MELLKDKLADPETNSRWMAEVQRALKMQPGMLRALYLRGFLHQVAGRHRLAIGDWQRIIKRGKRWVPVTHASLGRTYVELGDLERAVRHCQLAIKSNFVTAGSYTVLAHALARQGRLDDAEETVCKALEVRDNYLPALRLQAHLYRRMGRTADANEVLTSIAFIHLDRGALDSARQDFARVLALDDRWPEAHHGMAITMGKLGRRDLARSHGAGISR